MSAILLVVWLFQKFLVFLFINQCLEGELTEFSRWFLVWLNHLKRPRLDFVWWFTNTCMSDIGQVDINVQITVECNILWSLVSNSKDIESVQF